MSGLAESARLSQVALLPEELSAQQDLFPEGRLDQDLQQVDLRGRNSWRLLLAEVSTVELLEVQLVNAVAPFIFNARLKPLMLKTPERDKHIVNVSAVEGQFYRNFKTTRHPHTNMAKAALNMMTRTAATDYHADGIHMNSVDTGWVTDEDPFEIAQRKVQDHRFHPPLDIVDGAARIVDPDHRRVQHRRAPLGRLLQGLHADGLVSPCIDCGPWIAVCAIAGLMAVPGWGRGRSSRTARHRRSRDLTPEEQELVQLERAWDAAFVAKDIRFIERVLAEEFVATYGDGTRGDKAAELAQTLDFDQQVNSSVLDSFRVRIYGDTALVWFSRHMTGPKSGKVVAVTYRFVDVFVKRAGRWQCVSSQSTKVTPPRSLARGRPSAAASSEEPAYDSPVSRR